MLSAANLKELEHAGLRFFVGSRQAKALNDLARFFTCYGTNTDDGELVDTLTQGPQGVFDVYRISGG